VAAQGRSQGLGRQNESVLRILGAVALKPVRIGGLVPEYPRHAACAQIPDVGG